MKRLLAWLPSIRARLLASLLSAVALAAALTGAISYRSVLRESEALFDYQLQQMALSLRDQGAISADQAQALADRSFDFVVQIWSFDGELIYASRPGAAPVDLPPGAVIGFADVEGRQTTWRVYSTVARTVFGDRVIQVAQPVRIRRERAATAALRSAAPLLLAGPLLAGAVWLIVAASLQPLRRVADEVGRRGAHALQPLPASALPNLPTEVAPLVQALNTLLGQLDAAFSSQRDFVADAAHELRSPLTALKLQLRALEKAATGPEGEAARAQHLADLRQGVDRATRLVEQLLALARSEAPAAPLQRQPLDLAELARRAVADTVALATARGIEIELDAPPRPVPVQGNAQALYTALRNLADNAARYTPRGGRVQVTVVPVAEVATVAAAAGAETARVATADAPAAPGAGPVLPVAPGAGPVLPVAPGAGPVLIVDDSGPGIPAAERERVFDRFHRRLVSPADTDIGDEFSHGSGLGLAIVRGIALQHGASITLEDSPLGGLRARCCFPPPPEAAGGIGRA